ncbi:embryonic polarity protein dorsal-like [Bombus pascuorum]|uniref:embryonic polarity protein dorsal-like n=1 Tax=Bombus pascuorum TaxID=65598 RepID=UPI00298E5B40|nr:embryonic polarity protein dorsal-like [Bombus pascuorum]
MDNRSLFPYVEIIEQPNSTTTRFLYECESKCDTPIYGVKSKPTHKTYPSIRIVGYTGRAKIIVSCVTKDWPYRPHPYDLVGGNISKHVFVCTVEVTLENTIITFTQFGIKRVNKNNIRKALEIREQLGIDPFQTGFEHKNYVDSIDLNKLRLCFQVVLEGEQIGMLNTPLEPVVSNVIRNRSMSNLSIHDLSHCSASVAGGTKMILLCQKVIKKDIQIRFFEKNDEQVVWEGFGDFIPDDIYRQTAIVFRTPAYSRQEVTEPVPVYVQLRRPSDGATSKPFPFQMFPSNF